MPDVLNIKPNGHAIRSKSWVFKIFISWKGRHKENISSFHSGETTRLLSQIQRARSRNTYYPLGSTRCLHGSEARIFAGQPQFSPAIQCPRHGTLKSSCPLGQTQFCHDSGRGYCFYKQGRLPAFWRSQRTATLPSGLSSCLSY